MTRIQRVSALLTQYHLITTKTIDRIADIVFWPTFAVLLWGFMAQFLMEFDIHLTGLILAGFIFYQIFQRCQTDIPMYLLEDFWTNNLQNIFATPITKWDKLIALTIYSVIKSFISFAVVYILSYFLFSYNLLSIPPLYLALYTFSLLLFAVGLGIFLASIIFRFGTHVQMIAWGSPFLLQPIMAVFYPVSVLPLYLQHLAYSIPATYVFEGLRTVQETGVFNTQGYGMSLLLNAILILVACLFYARCFEHNKKHGRLVHVQ